MSIININKVDLKKQPLFFGEGMGIQRYDVFKYPKFFDLFQNQLSFFWKPEKINLSQDQADFKKLTDSEKRIFTKNLGFQTLLDSVQTRGIPNILEYCSNLELEACAVIWQAFEQIHSYSYTYIIKNIYPNPSEVFDSFMEDEEILKRASSVTKQYDNLINSISEDNEYDLKKKLYLTLVSINILEGIRFYVSFACSFAFAELGKMEGNAKIISEIQRDEQQHLAITQNLLKYLRNNPDEGFQQIVKDCEDLVIQMYSDSSEEEFGWADYLFKEGGMLGLNSEILNIFRKWLTDKRMKGIGVKPLFGVNRNPINWMNKWMSSKGVQVAPQEVEVESYKVDSLKQDGHKVDFNQFNF